MVTLLLCVQKTQKLLAVKSPGRRVLIVAGQVSCFGEVNYAGEACETTRTRAYCGEQLFTVHGLHLRYIPLTLTLPVTKTSAPYFFTWYVGEGCEMGSGPGGMRVEMLTK